MTVLNDKEVILKKIFHSLFISVLVNTASVSILLNTPRIYKSSNIFIINLEYLEYDSKLQPLVKPQFWSSGECVVTPFMLPLPGLVKF